MMSRIRRPVAVIVSRFPLLTETFVLREIDELEQQGQGVILVPLIRERPLTSHARAVDWVGRALYTPYLSREIVLANLHRLVREPLTYLRTLGTLVLGMWRSPAMLGKTLLLFPKVVYLAERLARDGIGHVHAHFATHPATAAFVVSRLTGIGYSITAHAHDIFVDRTFLTPKLRAARFTRVISGFNRQFLERLVPDLPPERIPIVRTGVPTEAYASAPALPAAAETRVITCVAALKPYKGLPVLIAACAELSRQGLRVRCDIVGDGPERRSLIQQIEAAKLTGQVRLLGPRTEQEVRAHLSDTDIVVLPSVVAPTGQMEGIPVALMEAMAAGRPVVASALSGIPELVQDGETGLLVTPGDHLMLAEAIRRLATDPTLAARLGTRARATVAARYELSTNVAALLDLLDRENPLPGDDSELSRAFAALVPQNAVIRRIRHRPDCVTLDVQIDPAGERRQVVMKQHRRTGEGRTPGDRAYTEFEALRTVHGHGVGVPEPLALHSPTATVLMARCDGAPLHTLLRAGWTRRGQAFDNVLGAIARTGDWLARLQRVPAVGDDAVGALLERSRRDAETCVRMGLLSSSELGALSRLDALAMRLAPLSTRAVLRHGDFWPGNVLVSADGIHVLDFEGASTGIPWEDAGYFLLHVDLFLAPLWRRHDRGPLRAAFLQAFAAGRPLDQAGLELAAVSAAFQVLAHGGDPAESRLLRSRRNRFLRRIFRAAAVRSRARSAAAPLNAEAAW